MTTLLNKINELNRKPYTTETFIEEVITLLTETFQAEPGDIELCEDGKWFSVGSLEIKYDSKRLEFVEL